MMNKLIIKICKSKDHFGATADNCEGLYAAGDTIEECKKDVLTAIKLIKSELPDDSCPEILKGQYELAWLYDF
ncbi:MAG: hypothetical protein ACI3YA_03625 [Alloprevotella sp.]